MKLICQIGILVMVILLVEINLKRVYHDYDNRKIVR